MDQVICININSFPAVDKEAGSQLFNNSIQGVLQLQSEEDRFFFYLDRNSGTINDLELADNFTFDDYLCEEEDQDLVAFLYEVEDKTPALDSLTEEQIDEITQYSFYVPDSPLDEYPDVYALTWTLSGYLFSLNTDDRWNFSEIEIFRADSKGQYVNENLSLKNISSIEHGITHFENQNSLYLDDILNEHYVSDNFKDWFESQTKEDRNIILEKLKLSCARKFQGGRPLFESLTSENGYREIRFSSNSGVPIRILFKHKSDNKQAILCGFTKKSNDGGYEAALEIAKREYDNFHN